MKSKPVLIIILVFLCLGIGSWQYFRSPAFALRELDQALAEKDLAVFYKRVDVEALYRSGVDALAIKGLADAEDPPGMLDKMGSNLSTGLDKFASSQSQGLIKHELELELGRDRNLWVPLAPQLEKSLLRMFFHDVKAIHFENWVYAEEGVLVMAKVDLLKMQKTYSLSLRLREGKSGRWQISAFEGLSSLLALYEKDRREKLEAFNAQVQKTLQEQLKFFGEVRVESSSAGLGTTLNLDLLFENKFPTEVTLIKGDLRGRGAGSRLKASFDSGAVLIKPAEKKVFLVKEEQFLSSPDEALHGQGLSFTFEEVRFADGKILKLANDFDEISL